MKTGYMEERHQSCGLVRYYIFLMVKKCFDATFVAENCGNFFYLQSVPRVNFYEFLFYLLSFDNGYQMQAYTK